MGEEQRKPKYGFDAEGRYFVEGYNDAKPFASFLPGIAGTMGIPLWLFYVNRGQGVASFGIEDKNGAMLEFHPADKAYRMTPTAGFRTWIRRGGRCFEPFAMHGGAAVGGASGGAAGVAAGVRAEGTAGASDGASADVRAEGTAGGAAGSTERINVSPNLLELAGDYPDEGLRVEVSYFTMPNESFAALVREVTITNTSMRETSFEALDGLPALIPHGMNHAAYKELGYTLKSWMDVDKLDTKVPYYRLRGSIADTAEVSGISGGHFYFGFSALGSETSLLAPIVDAELVFGADTTLASPERFRREGLEALSTARQVATNKVPSGFVGVSATLAPGERLRLVSMVGHAREHEQIRGRLEELARLDYVDRKRAEAVALAEGLVSDAETKTGEPRFDAYVKQNYMDNFLRGGYPLLLDNGTTEPFVYHVFSRKHGDLERDYNFFKLLPSYYSQGNGNYRDANQNRRCDVFFRPEVGDFNLRMFLSFLQPDGYNPLVVKGCAFEQRDAAPVLALVADPAWREPLAAFLAKPYQPGELLAFLLDRGVPLTTSAEETMLTALRHAEQRFEAEFGEGYWIDHWTYNMDLVDGYLTIYPDREAELLYGKRAYLYFDSPALVLPRSRKTVLTPGGDVRQYGAVEESEAKEALIARRTQAKHWVRTKRGEGDVYASTLFEKLLLLAVVKLATLDPEGLGIEMEAGKPGWNDSMNGLPGLFASGFGETCELKRLVAALRVWNARHGRSVALPVEAAELLDEVQEAMEAYERGTVERGAGGEANAGGEAGAEERNYAYWDRTASARERYRERVAFGFDGAERALEASELETFLGRALGKLQAAMDRAMAIGDGVFPTYFRYEVAAYTPIEDAEGRPARNAKGLPLVKAERFRRVDVPAFLEGPTRAMKATDDAALHRRLYERIRGSGIYDAKLKMYKVNAPLAGQPLELGRSTIFTPGWLENESVFMHMEYKYLLELLRAGLYEAFFEDLRAAMPPFLDPATYGRNPLENSSFIASGANPDESLHGRGFIARLSGSTAEFLHMWFLMMAGPRPFEATEGGLALRLSPRLPGWLFDDAGEVRFRLFGTCDVTYRNPSRTDTFALDPDRARYELTLADGTKVACEGAIREPYASMVREKGVSAIDVTI
ncbi:cellobiose phosphorylase [Paenibacillus sp. TRM 82003]|nr:cellobiose phosphorylase [Paenibacillus sp. TRM 82003]